MNPEPHESHSRRRRHTVIALSVAIIVVLLAAISLKQFRINRNDYDAARYPVRGMDVSHHNHYVNFSEVRRAGMSFVFLKASEGKQFRDSTFELNYVDAKLASLKVGAYHYFRFAHSGELQADNFIKSLAGKTLELGMAIDVDSGDNDDTGIKEARANLELMINSLRQQGITPVIYCNVSDYYRYVLGLQGDCPLWICSFTTTPVPSRWVFRQYSHTGKVPGVQGDVDLNIFNGNLRQWHAYVATHTVTVSNTK